MKRHFINLAKPVRELYKAGGTPILEHEPLCGFEHRQTTQDLRTVNCLLCLRSVAATLRAAARAAKSKNAQLNPPDLFDFRTDT